MPALVDEGAGSSVELPDGRTVEFAIRFSTRVRSARLRIDAREGLVVVVPTGLERGKVQQIVSSKADWIAERINEFDAVRHFIVQLPAGRPQSFDLPALAESWRVEYREMRRPTVGAKTDQYGRIVVFGAIHEVEACQAALRRWLARHATASLAPWLERVSSSCGLRPTDISIKNQRTRWGSCARTGRISLNCKLLFLPRHLVRYVMLHELCHLVEPNHSYRFWACLRSMDGKSDMHHGQMRDAWKLVPPWAQRGTGLSL